MLAQGVVENMKREDATKFKSLTTRWEKGWRMKVGAWKMKVRFVGQYLERLAKEGTQTSCGDYDVSCPGGVQLVRARWNTWPELL